MDTNALEVYLIGLPQSGKTTAFGALAGSRGEAHRKVTHVPDRRLDALFQMFEPQRQVHAEILFCDIFAQRAAELAGRKAEQFTAALGTADMLAIVVRCHGEFDADGSPLDPVNTLDDVLLELVVADLSVVQRRLERIENDLKKGKKELVPEQMVLQTALALLENEQPLSRLQLSEADDKLIRGIQLLTRKPVIVLANMGEDQVGDEPPVDLVNHAASRGFETVAFCAQVEAEIAGLEVEEQRAFLEDFGIAQPAREKVIRTCYHSLDLISFLTAGGKDEVRAWTIKRGSTAQEAAGVIHSDIARGFIRAETVAFEELARLGSFAACRDAGVLRLEGKEYVVQDGDVITFRFNV